MLSENGWRYTKKNLNTKPHLQKFDRMEARQKSKKKGEKLLACVCVYFFEVTQANNVQQFFFGVCCWGRRKGKFFFHSLPNNIDYYNWLMFTFHAKLCVCIFCFLSFHFDDILILLFFFFLKLSPLRNKCSLTEHGINF